MDAVNLPDELQSGFLGVGEVAQPRMEEQDGCGAQTDRSLVTFLSGPSCYTKVTFWQLSCLCGPSSSIEHEELRRVLAAVPKEIRAEDCIEGVTKYFAVLMNMLKTTECPESLAAAAKPLSLVLERVPAPMLRRRFLDTTKTFRSILASLACSSSSSALCSVLSCLATLLRKLVPWNKLVMRQAYQHLLSFTLHAEPQVQKVAQRGISSILFEVVSPAYRRAVRVTVKFCAQEIRRAGGTREATAILDVLTLLHDLLPHLPGATISIYCETLLHVMTLGQMLVMESAMQIFHFLFSAQSSHTCLPVELNAQIIEALYDYLPSESNLQPTVTWLDVMERAHIHLGRLQMELCWRHLPRLFAATVTLFLLPHPQVPSAAAKTLKMLLNKCVVPHMANLGPISTSASGPAASLCEMFRAVEDGLTYQYRKVRAPVLQVLEVFFKVCGKQGHPIMRKCLKTLCKLRLSLDFPDVTELDKAVGAAVSTMGPEVLLEAVPLGIKSREEILDFSRSWLLPVLQDHICSARLGFFIHYFLPLAAALKDRAMKLAQDRMMLKSKIYNKLEGQVWSLLPVFCRCPTDVVNSFRRLAHTLGMTLSERPDLHLTVCQALCTLITKGCQTAAERAEVSHFAKYFLPILFIMYRQPNNNRAHQQTVLDTIRTYLTITDQQMVCRFLQDAGKMLLWRDPHIVEFTRLSNLDLVMAMIPYADEPTLSTLYHTIQRFLQVLGVCETAAMLLVKMGQAFLCFGPTPQEAMQRFLYLVSPGLGGSVSMINCTVLVLTRLLFNFKEHLGRDEMEHLLRSVCLLLGFRTRCVVKAVLGFLRAALLLLDDRLLAPHIPAVLEALQGLPGITKHHFRAKLKFIRNHCIHLPPGHKEDYTPKKGRDDVKTSQLDPYACFALNSAMLNRREKVKMQGHFKGLMKGAQHGIQAAWIHS